jgi:hypothetical protein
VRWGNDVHESEEETDKLDPLVSVSPSLQESSNDTKEAESDGQDVGEEGIVSGLTMSGRFECHVEKEKRHTVQSLTT